MTARRASKVDHLLSGRSHRSSLAALVCVCGVLCFVPSASAWTPEPARYGVVVASNVPITMSDGVVLRADVYSPADPATGQPAAGPFPVVVSETPYGKQLATTAPVATGYESYLVQRGYIAAVVDVRGEGASGGSFDLFGA